MIGKLLAQRTSGRVAAELPLLVKPLQTIPFHRLRLPGVAAAVAYNRLRDALEH